MKVLHVPFCYYPDPVGGTEVYVASLAQAQAADGWHVAVAAPGDENRKYSHEGIDVHRYRISSQVGLREIYGAGDSEAARNFLDILERARPDVVHLHASSPGVSIRVAQAVRPKGVPVFFTYHTPAVTCVRGTLLRWGREACDGEMLARRCSRCLLHGRGMPMAASWVLGSLPEAVGGAVGTFGLDGRLWTALRSTELVGLLRSTLRQMLLHETDHVFAVCEWVRDVLIANGVPPEKITLSRQGVPSSVTFARQSQAPAREGQPIRFAFLGRLNAAKGVRILVDAFAMRPEMKASLDIFGVVQDAEAEAMRGWLLEQTKSDGRIRLRAPLGSAEVIERLRSYDALLVPSQALETGPLVVYEAFAAGIPVVGSALGGIAELVRDNENGILVTSPSVSAWADAMARLAGNSGVLGKLKAAPKPFRTAAAAASEVSAVYMKVLADYRERVTAYSVA